MVGTRRASCPDSSPFGFSRPRSVSLGFLRDRAEVLIGSPSMAGLKGWVGQWRTVVPVPGRQPWNTMRSVVLRCATQRYALYILHIYFQYLFRMHSISLLFLFSFLSLPFPSPLFSSLVVSFLSSCLISLQTCFLELNQSDRYILFSIVFYVKSTFLIPFISR